MTIELSSSRKEFYEDRTIGGFYDEKGNFRWYTMEDKDRKLEAGGIKIAKETAIPRGRYKIELDWSPKRRGLVPYLRNVPQFTAVQIHVGNDPDDVEGCTAIGKTYDAPSHTIGGSVSACEEFYPWILGKIIESRNDVWLTVN